ncbi:MAG: 30S ribosomal protein S20 [Planctomyces sp.]|jgi:small subunit ribosomal protein S20|nr:30S ribosomal protein S20 [Planctomyces sp.]
MPNSPSAAKSLRQSLVKRDRNRQQRSALRTKLKKFRALLAAKPTQEAADQEFSLVVKALDQAASKDLIHKNTASRVKSRLAALKKKTFVG